MLTVLFLPLFASFPVFAVAQSCENAGVVNGSSCDCPTGFGGSNCSQPACGGNVFQGTDRSLTPINSNGFANLTAAGCSCQSGWTGTGCNVCQTASACASGYSSSTSGSSMSSSGLTGLDDGQNRTLVCNNSPRVWAAGQLSCNVNVRLLLVVVAALPTYILRRIRHCKHYTLSLLYSTSNGFSIPP